MSIYDMIRKQGQQAEQSKSGSVGHKLRENGEDKHIYRDATHSVPMCSHCHTMPATRRNLFGKLEFCVDCWMNARWNGASKVVEDSVDRT